MTMTATTTTTQTDTQKPIRKPRNKRIARTQSSTSPAPIKPGHGFEVPVGETGETFDSVWRFGD